MALRTSSTIWEDTSDPGVNDDGTTGVQLGDFWRNTTTGQVFYNDGVGTGAAIWYDSGDAIGASKKANLAGTAAPTATDDSAAGYSVGSIWVDTTNDKAYICVDNTATAAIWKETTAVAASLPPDSNEANATGTTTTTSTSDVNVASMALTPPAGDWVFFFSSSVSIDSADNTVFVSLYIGGTKVNSTERRFRTENSIPGTPVPIATHDQVTNLNGSTTVTIRWRTTGSTARMYQRKLTCIKVNDI